MFVPDSSQHQQLNGLLAEKNNDVILLGLFLRGGIKTRVSDPDGSCYLEG